MWPLINSMAGTTSNSNVTIVETGFPGRPNAGFSRGTNRRRPVCPGESRWRQRKFRTELTKNLLNQIVLADRHTARKDQNIGFDALANQIAKLAQLIGCAAQHRRLAACQRHLCGQGRCCCYCESGKGREPVRSLPIRRRLRESPRPWGQRVTMSLPRPTTCAAIASSG